MLGSSYHNLSMQTTNGTGGNRTHGLSLRRRSLYPSELQPQEGGWGVGELGSVGEKQFLPFTLFPSSLKLSSLKYLTHNIPDILDDITITVGINHLRSHAQEVIAATHTTEHLGNPICIQTTLFLTGFAQCTHY